MLRAVEARDELLSDANEAYQDNKGPEALRTYQEHCDATNHLCQVLAAAEAFPVANERQQAEEDGPTPYGFRWKGERCDIQRLTAGDLHGACGIGKTSRIWTSRMKSGARSKTAETLERQFQRPIDFLKELAR